MKELDSGITTDLAVAAESEVSSRSADLPTDMANRHRL